MSQPPKAVEFKLRSTNNSAEFSHNVMVLGGPPVNISSFTTPVRLVRTNPPQQRQSSETQQSNNTLNPSFTSQSWSQRREKKTKIVFHGGRSNTNSDEDKDDESYNNMDNKDDYDENNQPSLSKKNAPWLLEDFDGQHSFESQSLASDGKYFVFINQGNEFKVLLVNKWYKFRPKPSWTPLSLEEAEERMQNNKKGQQMDRWLMRKREDNKKKIAEDKNKKGDGRLSEFAFLDSIIEEEEKEGREDGNISSYKSNKQNDDDDEDDDHNSNILAGDQVRRMLKRTGDKESKNLYSSKDADGDIVEDEDDFEYHQDQNIIPSTISITNVAEDVDPSLIEEKEVIAFINKAGSLTTKELIAHFRVKLAMNSCNKEKFREIVKKIVMVVEGDSYSDKLICLRNEYRSNK